MSCQSLLPPSLQNWSLAFALPLAFVVAGVVGIAIERLVIRFLYTRPLETLLATWGVSLILQQLVRSLFGAANRQVRNPPFMSGAFELGGLSITTNRLWIIVLSALVFIGLQLVLRTTPFGLQMRAVTQNRRMAASMGISTARVDMLAFGLGSGVAGIAGVALSQIDNVSPNLGQGYIIDSFMVVVFGGVGNLWGTAFGALLIGLANKLLEPLIGAGSGPDRASGLHHPLHSETAARALRSRAGARWKHERPARPAWPGFHRDPHRRSHLGASAVAWGLGQFCHFTCRLTSCSSLGKYLCYAILAVALDLVWGYCGILSLGHGAFFALGGYAMGMYLMRQIGTRGVYANPILPDFMVFLNWMELPVAWWGFNWFPYAMAMVVLVPGLLALAFGWFAFRSRVTGVYLSIITQAMTFALFKEFFRNDFGFGGNNGLTDFKDLLGFSLQIRVDQGRVILRERDRAHHRLRHLARDHRLEIRQVADRRARRGKPHALPRLPRRKL